jgi:crotonobetainyl-CoA:carnitine CoA-transferase CaiB-like acyl-CoA transferase
MRSLGAPEVALSEITSPLQGIRVLEMTEALAGPYCAMMLGDLGAEVIKIERPGVGDQSRRWGPPFVDGESAYYLSVNRNKRSIELDIKDAADLTVLHRLIERADVFISNNPRMESLRRAELDPETMRELNPRLVYAAISGFGHTGPKAGRAGYDLIAQGGAGLMALTGGPEDGPIRFPTPMADFSAGVYSLIGILAALYARDNASTGSGEGQFIDVSLLDSQVTWLANIAGSFFATGDRPPKMGNLHPTITPYQPVMARDRMLIVAVGTERLWQRFCAVLGVEETLMRDPRFDTNPRRNAHRSELIPLLEEALAGADADDWTERLVAAGVPAGPINFPDQTLADEQLIARGMIVEVEHPLLGLVKAIGSPIRMSVSGPTYRRHPPLLGEHNEEIRSELETGEGGRGGGNGFVI